MTAGSTSGDAASATAPTAERTVGAAADVEPVRPRFPDSLALAFVLVLTALYAWAYVDFGLPPAEDASMLMRYARNLAAGHGMVWNVGEPPVDGATDFLFVVAIGALHRIGPSLEHAVLALTIGAHFATVALVYAGLRLQGAGSFASGSSALYVALGPGLSISAAYFGATFFALALTAAWMLGQRVVLGGRRRWRDCFAFAVAALIAALVRPEGVLMAAFMTLGLCLALPFAAAARLALAVAAVLLPLGGGYFLWRWDYFGHPLPNPFYRRGSWQFQPREWEVSRENAVRLCAPFLLAGLPGLASPKTWRLTLAFATPLVGFTAVWTLFSNDMNFAGRYQYPLLPIAALSWYPLVRTLPRRLGLSRLLEQQEWLRFAVFFACIFTVEALLLSQFNASRRIRRVREGNYDMAMLLHRHADRGYALATTEAGLLPLYSQWRALDTFGLNDSAIAQRGFLTSDDLHRYRPAVVMWHDYGSPIAPPTPGRVGAWVDMMRTLQHYVDDHGFVLAAAFGITPGDSHYYWVAPDLPECAELVHDIRSLAYPWPKGGGRATDFARGLPTRTCAEPR